MDKTYRWTMTYTGDTRRNKKVYSGQNLPQRLCPSDTGLLVHDFQLRLMHGDETKNCTLFTGTLYGHNISGIEPLYDIGLDVFEIWIDKNGDGNFTQG